MSATTTTATDPSTTDTTTTIPKVYTVGEAAPIIGLPERTVYHLARNQRLEHHRVGTRILISEDNIKRFLAATLRPPLDPD